MSFMKLPPEVVRLRRVAKAHMAGEFSREEYRQVRREVVDGFSGMGSDDDTAPRLTEAAQSGATSPDSAVRPGFTIALLLALIVVWLGALPLLIDFF